jgi:hypothetical protein
VLVGSNRDVLVALVQNQTVTMPGAATQGERDQARQHKNLDIHGVSLSLGFDQTRADEPRV